MSPRRTLACLRVAAVCAAAALALSLPAQAARLAGRLVDRGSRHPVEGALVLLLETGRQMLTDGQGGFAFDALSPGRYTLSTHHVAYADLERAVDVPAQGAEAIELGLGPALYRADEVIVRSSRSLAAARSGPHAVDAMTRERLAERPVVTVPDALAGVPGLALVRDGTWGTAVALRGMSRANVVTLVDDTRLETAHDIAGALSLVSMADLERVEVMKSTGSVLFGSGSLGGAIQLVTRRAQFTDRIRRHAEWTASATGVDHGTAHHGAAEISGERQALRVSGGFRHAGDTATPAGDIAGSRYNDWDLSASLAMRTWTQQSLRVSYQRVQAEDTGIPGGAPFAATAAARFPHTRRELLALDYTVPNPSPRVALLGARVAHQDIVRRVELIQSPTVTVTPHAVHATTSARVEARLLPEPHHLLIVGAEAWRRNLDSRRERRLAAQNRVVGERPVPESSHLSAGLYAQDEWTPAGPRARFVFGGRYDFGRTRNETTFNPVYVTTNGVTQTSPPGQVVLWHGRTTHDASWDASAGLNVAVLRSLSLSLLAATAFRSPSLEERFQYLDLGTTNLHVGNPDLLPERSAALDLGARFQARGTTLRADAFVNQLVDMVAEVPGSYAGRCAYVKTNIGRARLVGGELSAEQPLGPFAVASGTLAYVRGRDLRERADLAQIPPLSSRVELAAAVSRAGTLRVGFTADAAQNEPGPGEHATAGWTSWNAGFTSAPLALSGRSLRVRAGIDNLLDRAYRRHLSTLRGSVLLEPGRNVYVSATLAL